VTVEILRLFLRDGVDEGAWLACDGRVQTDFAYQQPGLLRRTAARGEAGRWAIITQWRSADDANAARARWDGDPLMAEWLGMVDVDTLSTERFEPLE
jgi:hypothetical protein